MRHKATSTDLSDVLPEDVEKQVKEEAEISMGTEISDFDIMNISELCDQASLAQFLTEIYYWRMIRCDYFAE